MAAAIFSVSYDSVDKRQRFLGKGSVLGCGYGMGAPKFQQTCLAQGQNVPLQLARKAVTRYRETNYRIPKAWKSVEEAFRKAIFEPDSPIRRFRCIFFRKGVGTYIKLPSQRCLCYRDARVVDGRIVYKGVNPVTKKWEDIETYGGKLVENIVQAVARDILVEAMLRIDAHPDYTMLMTVHDEVVAQAQADDADENEFNDLVRQVPEWAEGCPVDSETWIGKRYRK